MAMSVQRRACEHDLVSMTMASVVARPSGREIPADAVRQAALGIADCRSVTALRDALFGCAYDAATNSKTA
jgi:hypothetical protein